MAANLSVRELLVEGVYGSAAIIFPTHKTYVLDAGITGKAFDYLIQTCISYILIMIYHTM